MNKGECENNIQIGFKREHNNNLVSISAQNDYTNNYQIKMIQKNNPDHILKIMTLSVDGKNYFEYDITSKQQFSSVYDYNKLTIEDVKSVCVNISELVRTVDAYMLDLDKVLLKPSNIYMNIVSKKMYFIYFPEVEDNDFRTSLKDLFEYILEHFDHTTGKENVVKLYDIYQRIILQDYDLYNLMKLFKNSSEELCESSVISSEYGGEADRSDKHIFDDKEDNTRVGKKPIKKEISTVISEPVKSDIELKTVKGNIWNVMGIISLLSGAVGIMFPGIVGIKLSFSICVVCMVVGILFIGIAIDHKMKKSAGNTKTITRTSQKCCQILEEEDSFREINTDVNSEANHETDKKAHAQDNNYSETQLLTDFIAKEEHKRIRIKRLDETDSTDSKVLKIEKFPYVFGNMDGMVDFVIKSPVVSRIHARIIRGQEEEESFYLEDMNSLNGSFINDERVLTHTKKELHNGDIMRLSNVCFEVEIS
ncbi:MAG: DUF6382 domain-containing protein [Lachnospira sp.]